jgi:hypothetical protein
MFILAEVAARTDDRTLLLEGLSNGSRFTCRMRGSGGRARAGGVAARRRS